MSIGREVIGAEKIGFNLIGFDKIWENFLSIILIGLVTCDRTDLTSDSAFITCDAV